MREAVTKFNQWLDAKLQAFSDRSLAFLININDYHVAAAFMLLLLIGSATEPNNAILAAIAQRYPLLTPLWWNVTFAICALMLAFNHEGEREDVIAVLFFIAPVTFFFYFLISLTLENRSRPTPYFLVMLIIACVFVINVFVARTRVVNYFKSLVVKQKLQIEALEVENRLLTEKLKSKGEASTSAT